MNNGVAGGANRSEVLDWINLVNAPDRSKGHDVVNMNKALCNFTKSFSEIHAADLAPMAMMGNASSARQRVTFIGIHNDFPFGTFGKGGGD